MKDLRLREEKCLVWGHTDSKWLIWGFPLHLLDSQVHAWNHCSRPTHSNHRTLAKSVSHICPNLLWGTERLSKPPQTSSTASASSPFPFSLQPYLEFRGWPDQDHLHTLWAVLLQPQLQGATSPRVGAYTGGFSSNI